ncbi:MAG: hypothetical protein H7318_00630 [Oligoflexus sp.]|nr:hypothetical protein [Oligoflexus sp.]
MKILKFAMMFALIDMAQLKAADFSIPVTDGLVSEPSSLSLPIRYISKKERDAARMEKNCITTSVMIDGKPGKPIKRCSPLYGVSQWQSTQSAEALSPINPSFELSGLGF